MMLDKDFDAASLGLPVFSASHVTAVRWAMCQIGSSIPVLSIVMSI
ncbi:MAG: hypothetical protein ACJAYF_003954 [Arenicella sp.]|jgi:hypothetical protein